MFQELARECDGDVEKVKVLIEALDLDKDGKTYLDSFGGRVFRVGHQLVFKANDQPGPDEATSSIHVGNCTFL